MASLEPQPSDPPAKSPPSDQLTIRTPKKLPDPSRTIRPSPPLPDKYEMLVRMYDALDSSLKLLRLRNSVPVFSKIRVMVETISERRFTHQHLAQLKFLLPDEIGVGKVLFPDERTSCMKHDLHLSIAGSNKRKRGSKHSCLRDRLISRLRQFRITHPEGTEIPEKELPEPFNQRNQDHLLNTIKQSSYSVCDRKYSTEASDMGLAQASHLSLSFNKHFSKRDSGDRVKNNIQKASVLSVYSPSISISEGNEDKSKSVTPASVTEETEQPAVLIKQKPSAVKTLATPVKSVQTSMTPSTPALQTPKMFKVPCDNSKAVKRSSCARSLMFDSPSKNVNIELQVDDTECSNILDILPENLLQSLKKKEEKKKVEQTRRKLMIVNLPKMFDRIQLLFQNPKSPAMRKEALIRNLTERHSDITDESEIEEQLKLLQEIIPEWIVHKFSPSGNKLCSINKALNPNTLRQQLCKFI